MNRVWLSMMACTVLATGARADALCESGARYPTLGEALADADCAEIALEPGRYREAVTVGRSVAIRGAGRSETVLGCDAGPCILVLPGAALALEDLAVSSRGTALSAWWARLEVRDARITPIGDGGGWIKLRDTDAVVVGSDIEVAGRRPMAVQALSGRGHDLTFEDVRFLGTAPASGTLSAVYSNAYGVACKGCVFVPTRPEPPVDEAWVAIEPEDSPPVGHEGPTDTTRWPSLFCGPATESDLADCLDQCGDRPVGHCKRTWEPSTESCVPEAVCVAPGEVPFF